MSWGSWIGSWFGSWFGTSAEPEPEADASYWLPRSKPLPTVTGRAAIDLPPVQVAAVATSQPPATTARATICRRPVSTARGRTTVPGFTATARATTRCTVRARGTYDHEPVLQAIRADDDLMLMAIAATISR